ncbi:MAG: hypothetical protein Q4P71_09470 [Actinomycetaceae bacterium]|nr:hypothetical protein [Actinomycetaceae bacterium]
MRSLRIVRLNQHMFPSGPGPLQRTSRRFALFGQLPMTYWDRAIAVQLARIRETINNSAPDSALSLQSAALAHGLDVLLPTIDIQLVITCTHSRPQTRIGIRGQGFAPSVVRRSRRRYPPSAFAQTEYGKALDLPYLIIEYLAYEDIVPALVTIESAVRKIVQPDRRDRKGTVRRFRKLTRLLRNIITRLKDRRYTKRMLKNLELVSPWSESAGETITKLRMLEAGLPRAIQQQQISTSSATYFADFCFPCERIVVEFDGLVKYREAHPHAPTSTPLRILEDVKRALDQRERDIKVAFPTIVRITWAQLWDLRVFILLRRLLNPKSLAEPLKLNSNFDWYTYKRTRIHEESEDYAPEWRRKAG